MGWLVTAFRPIFLLLKYTMEKLTKAAQEELLSIDQNLKTKVKIPRSKKTYNIGWLKPYTTNRVSAIFLKNEIPEDIKKGDLIQFMTTKSKLISKMASLIVLNDFWKIKFWYPFLWRWMFYFKQYEYEQLQPIILEGKKKMPVQGFYISMALASGMMDTTRTMMKEEAEQYLRELSSAADQRSEKSSLGH